MCRSPLVLAAVALSVLGATPALAGDSGGQWSINRGANAPNVQVNIAPLPEDRSDAACGCEQQAVMGGTQYTFPSASGVTIYITPQSSGYATPFGFGYGGGLGVPYGYGYGGGAANPQVVVWANQSGGAY